VAPLEPAIALQTEMGQAAGAPASCLTADGAQRGAAAEREKASARHQRSRGRRFLFALLAASVIVVGHLSAQSLLSIGSVPGFPGSTVSLPILLNQATNVTAAQFDVVYNPAKVTAGQAAPAGVFSNYVVRSREIAPGIRRVLVFSRENASITVTNTRSAAQIPFTVAPTEHVSSGSIIPGSAQLAQSDATSISPLALEPGAIFVQWVSLQPDGAQLFLPSAAGTRYVVEASTNFFQWTDIATNTAFGDYLEVFDPGATNFPYRFYRSRRDLPP
jgi:Cohesin domain